MLRYFKRLMSRKRWRDCRMSRIAEFKHFQNKKNLLLFNRINLRKFKLFLFALRRETRFVVHNKRGDLKREGYLCH